MAFCNIDTIEEVSVKLVVKLGAERLAQVLGTCSQNLVWSHWRSLYFLLHNCMFFLRWGCEVRVPVQVPFFEPDRFDLHGLDLLEILLVV
jgi:hypothetical protein